MPTNPTRAEYYIRMDSARLDNALFQLREHIGRQYGPQLLKHEAGQMVVAIIRMGNKLVKYNEFSGKPNETARVVRERAVLRAISNTMRPITEKDFTRSGRFAKAFKKIVDSGNYATFNKLSSRIGGGPIALQTAVMFSSNVHRSKIGPMGKINQDYRQRVLGRAQASLWAQYVKAIKGRVGWKEAGLMPAANQLGVAGKIPAFITRHSAAPGSILEDYNTFSNPTVMFKNSSNKDPQYYPRILGALTVRQKAIMTKCKRLLLGKAVNLGFETSPIPAEPADWN